MGSEGSLRPRLIDDVRFVKSDDGVYVRGDHGACTITGNHSHAWLSRLAPYLTGEHTLSELTESLSAERREMVERLVSMLAEQRFIVDARAEEPHTLSERELAVYAPEIAFIGYAFDSAARRFERLREARVALAVTGGAGPVAAALLEAGLGSGWRDVRVSGADLAGLTEAIERGRRDDAQQVLPQVEIPADAGIVLHVHGGAGTGELTEVARACELDGIALTQIWVREDEAWLAQVCDHERGPCWGRVTALPQEPGEPGARWLTGPVPMVVAAQAALWCFEHLTGMAAPPVRPTLTRIDLRTLETRRHRAQTLRLAAAGRPAQQPVTAADLLERATAYVDPRTGVLGELDEGGLVQVPWRVCAATVSDPAGVQPSWAPAPRVFGWGPDRQTAQIRALLAGLCTYQALLEAERPMVPYAAPTGVAAGLSWPQAVAGGLAQHCEALLARADRDGFPVVAPLADPQVSRLSDLLGAAGEHVVIRDLTAGLGLPAYAAGDTGPACGTTPATAMRRALERMLLAWQARTEGQPCYAGPVPRWADDICGRHDEAQAAVEVLTAALTRAGHVPAVSVLGRDTAVARLLPFVARVVCERVVCDE